MVGFVDDTMDSVPNKSKGNDIELCTMVQDSVQSW